MLYGWHRICAYRDALNCIGHGGYGPWSLILDEAIESMAGKSRAEAVTWLADLTFLETEQLVFKLKAGSDDPHREFETAHKFGTMGREEGKWKKQAEKERLDIRIPAIAPGHRSSGVAPTSASQSTPNAPAPTTPRVNGLGQASNKAGSGE